MKYTLNTDLGECVALPTLVLARLQQAPEEGVRVALYFLSNPDAQAPGIAGALGIPVEKVYDALEFWAAAGLVTPGEAPAPLPARHRLTTQEVAYAARHSSELAGLMDTAQTIMGEVLSPTEMQTLATLHMEDGLPTDLLLAALSHFVGQGKRSIRYIERRLLTLKRDGIDTLEAFELYQRQQAFRAEREELTARLLGISPEGFTAAQRNTVALWYERYAFDDAMVEAGALRCGANNTVKYLNGILRNWHGAGIRRPEDIPDAPANLAPAAPAKPPEDDFVARRGYGVRRRFPLPEKAGAGENKE